MSCVCKIKHNVDTCKSTSDSLQIFYCDVKKEYTGYCFSCAAKGLPAYVANPYSDGEAPKPPKAKTKEEIEAEIQEVRELGTPTFDYRGIPKEYFRKSGVRLAFSEYDGKTPFSFNFPMSKGDDLVGFKTVMLDKKAMWSMGEVRDCDLYNWKVAKAKGTKRLYITEGQWDCHALEYMLEKSSGGKYKYAVTSIPNGVDSAAKTIGRQLKEIRSLFEEVVLVFDNDEPGQNAVRDVQKVFPEVMEAPHVSGIKDANDALLSGNYSTFVDYVMWKARKPPMEGVVTVNEVLSKGEQKPELGLSYPWETMTDIMYGQRFSESTCIAGGVSCGKCHGIDEPIMMFDGSIKKVQDVVVGDLLMGDDSTPRKVRSLARGKDKLYRVVPIKGDSHVFNEDHVLAIYITNSDREYLVDGDGKKHNSGEVSTITISTYLRSSNKFKTAAKLYKVSVDFPDTGSVLPIPPYIFGLWLGDGSSKRPQLTTSNPSVKKDWISWGESVGMSPRIDQGSGCEEISLTKGRGSKNPLIDMLRGLGVWGNKHIPDIYLKASREDRLQLLAGILDTDGHLYGGCYDLVLKQEVFARNIEFLAASLGFSSKVVSCTKNIKSTNFSGQYFRQIISGEVSKIPCKVKVAAKRKLKKNVLVTGFNVEYIGEGDYFGFDIDGNRLYVMGDFFVTHNTVLAHEIGAWNAHVHKEPVFMALLEEANIKTCWNIAAKIDSIPYNRPEVYEANKDRYYETIRKLEDRLFLWNSTGSSSYRFDLKEILDAIRFNNMEYGCRFAFIDNMTRVVDQMPTTEANEFINKYSSEIANLATELDMHIYLFSHLNPPKGKDAVSHENGGEVYPGQLTGSRGIMRSFPNLVGFERNKYATEGREHNSFISIIKNRDYGNERKFKTKYDAMNTGRLLEYNWEGDKLY